MRIKPIGAAVIAAVLTAGTLTPVANANYVGTPQSVYAGATDPIANPFGNDLCSIVDEISVSASQTGGGSNQSVVNGAYRMYAVGTQNESNNTTTHTVQIGNEIDGVDQAPRYREAVSLTVENSGQVPLVAQTGNATIGASQPVDVVELDSLGDIAPGESKTFDFTSGQTGAYQWIGATDGITGRSAGKTIIEATVAPFPIENVNCVPINSTSTVTSITADGTVQKTNITVDNLLDGDAERISGVVTTEDGTVVPNTTVTVNSDGSVDVTLPKDNPLVQNGAALDVQLTIAPREGQDGYGPAYQQPAPVGAPHALVTTSYAGDYSAVTAPAGATVNLTPQVTQDGEPASVEGHTFAVDTSREITYDVDNTATTGWTYEVDPVTGVVTATIPSDAGSGDLAYLPIVMTNPDGSTTPLTAEVAVRTRDESFNPEYVIVSTAPGKEVTSHVGGNTSPEAKYSTEEGYTAPEGWTVVVKPNGDVVATPPAGATPGTSISVPVLVTYPNGETQIVNAPIVVLPTEANLNDPGYQTKVTDPEVPVDSPQIGDTTMPEGTKYEVPATVKDQRGNDWAVTVDENTGVVTATPPATVRGGDIISVPVTVNYPDGSTETVRADFTVTQTDQPAPTYDSVQTTPGTSVTIVQNNPDVPAGSTYEISDAPEGWTVEIDTNTGEITAVPPADAKPGDYEQFTVTVTYPNGETNEVPATVTVTDVLYNPRYEDTKTRPGTTVYLNQTGDNTIPGGTKYTINQNDVPEGWTITIDENTGTITATPPENAQGGDYARIPVTLTYPNGTSNITDAFVAVEVDLPPVPRYDDGSTPPATEITLTQGNTGVPEGSTYEITPGWEIPEGWTVTVDENTGDLKVTPPADAQGGDYVRVPVTVTYPDGRTGNADGYVTVTQVTPDTPPAPGFGDDSGLPGSTVIINQTTPNIPEGSTYILDPNWTVPEGWTVNVDPGTGQITVTIPESAEPGDYIRVPVIVEYPDGTTGTGTGYVNVLDPDPSAPNYPVEGGDAGTTVIINQGNNEVPEGSTYTIDQNWTIPPGWTVNVDPGTGQITVNIPEDAKPGNHLEIPVVVEYPDGETGTTTAVVVVEGGIDDYQQPPATQVVPGQQNINIEINIDNRYPEGTTYAIDRNDPNNPLPADWDITVNEGDGTITVDVPQDVEPGTVIRVPVIVTVPGQEPRTEIREIRVTEYQQTPTQDGSAQGSSGDVAARCVANAVSSPLLWLIPIGLLAAAGGELARPYMGVINNAIGSINAQLGTEFQSSQGLGGQGGSSDNEAVRSAQAEINALTQQLNNIVPGVRAEQLAGAAGAIALGLAAAGLLAYWCTTDPADNPTNSSIGDQPTLADRVMESSSTGEAADTTTDTEGDAGSTAGSSLG